MKLITDSNLELIIQRFYERLLEEFPSLTVENANKLTQGRTLTIGETGKVFDGSEDVFWSLNEIGAVSKGTISDLNTSNKTVVGAINELQNNKASVSYVNNAIENVTIDDAVTAVELIGNVEDVEFDFVTQEELEDALANLDDIDIEGMVTAVDVGNVDIEQGGSNNGGNLDLSSITMYDIKAYFDDETATVGSEIDALWSGYNELFQSANNGKELIASAIGEPLNAEDTFSAMSNDINGLLSTFKTNMMNNGVTVESGDKFKALIDKIATLADSEGKGIQHASGQIDADSYTFTNVNSTHTFSFNEPLNFTPTYLFIRIPYVRYSSTNGSGDSRNAIVSNLFNDKYDDWAKQLRVGCISSEGILNIKSVSSSGFVMEGDTNLTFGYSSSTGYDSDYYIDWYAFGVGEEDTTLRDSLASILQEEGVSVTEEDNMASLISKVDGEFNRQVVPQGTATASDVASGKTFINSTGQLLTGTASASENGLVLKTGTVTTGDNGIFEISNLDIEPLIFWATTDCTHGIEEISYNRYKSTDSFETSLYLGEESTNTFDKLYFSNFGSNYNIGVTNNRIRLLSTYGTTIYYNILGIGEGGNVSGGGSSSGNYHTIMENNALVNNYQFFNSASSYGNNFQHSNTTGLYSSSLDSGYVSYITLISTIDFNNYSAIEIDAFNYHSGSSTEFCVFASSKALNQISKTSINTIVSMTDEKTVSSTNTSTFIFDLSDFSGTYYLGIARVANSTSLHIKGIRLIKSDSSGSGSQVQPRV